MRYLILVAALAALSAPIAARAQQAGPAPAAADPITVGLTVGTLGVGLEGGWRPLDYLGFRLGARAIAFDYHRSINGIPYNFGANLSSGGPILDVYPFGGGFRLSFGVNINGNNADVTATPSTAVHIGSTTYTPAEIGTLTGKTDYDRVAPYLGIGYAGRVSDSFVLAVDAGVFYQGQPRVSLAASGPLAGSAQLQSDLAQESRSIRSKIDWTAWYPAVQLSALFRF